MLRFLAGAASCFLLLTGAFLIWQSRADERPDLPAAPAPRAYSASMLSGAQPLQAPEATPQSREQKRFSRYDRNKDGKVEADEYLAARRRNFDKLDLDHNGALSFQEYAIKGIQKFQAAGGSKGWLSPAEFVATAPPPAKRKTCSCGRTYAAAQQAENGDD
ncbi:MAG: EF-hand domain-containing protein [Sphingomonas sp.]|nr:EF-hand domain-containing protein [Sphingomonas sp.]